jgi:alpha-tubulin suppressor-like RCC1 family protein
MFLDRKPFFEIEPYSENTQFVIKIIKEFGVTNIDYLACNTLSYTNWVSYYELLTLNTGVIVGASNDQTGNIKYGGDWLMESTGQDIELIYFTKSIEYYQYLLDGFVASFIIIKSNYNYYAAGLNSGGNFGNGTTTNSSLFIPALTPLPSGKIIKIDAFTSFNNTVAYTFITYDDNTVYCCGNNTQGQFGNGDLENSSSLIPAFSTLPPGKVIKQMYLGQLNIFLLMTDNTVYCCGSNFFGQFGNGENANLSSSLIPAFTPFPPGKIIKHIYCLYNCTFVLMTDNTIFCCGTNAFGQFGDNTTTNSFSLIPAFTYNYPPGKIISTLYTAQRSVFVRMTDNSVYCCGNNAFGIFGNNTTDGSLSLIEAFNTLPSDQIIQQIITTIESTLVITSTNDFYICGANASGQFGNNTTTNSPSLIQAFTTLPNGLNITAISMMRSNSYVLTNTGSMYVCGDNTYGQLGLGPTVSSSSFIQSPMSNISYMLNSTILNTICFKSDSKILTDKGYVPIQELRKGDLVKTLLHGYKPIDMIGKRDIYHPAISERIKDQLYQCSHPEVFEPLVITGCHSILVENSTAVVNAEQIEKVKEVNGGIYLTDGKLRLPACVDERASVYEIPGNYTIYHIALEHEDYFMNYGIYANGLLVESCSKRYLSELSNMVLIEGI